MHCEPFVDETGRVTGFMCGPSKRAKPCAFCGKPSKFLCDGKWVVDGQKTSCDKPLCDGCRKPLPGKRDYCPDCDKRSRASEAMTPRELERGECILVALQVASE